MHDLISRQAAINRATKEHDFYRGAKTISDKARRDELLNVMCWLGELPSAQPETSRIERELHGKTPEEQYEFLYWLLLNFGLTYTDSRLAVIEWLKGEK